MGMTQIQMQHAVSQAMSEKDIPTITDLFNLNPVLFMQALIMVQSEKRLQDEYPEDVS